MLFSPRKPKLILERILHFMWPKSGWRRALKYIGHRIGRMKGETGGIARGFAWGVSLSFTPFIGAHMLLAIGISWLIGANLFAAALGTFIGNPLTLPFMLALSFYVGNWILGRDILHISHYMSLEFFKDRFMDLFWPIFVGSIPLALFSWVVTYLIVHDVVVRYRNYRLTHPRKPTPRPKK